MSPWIDKNGVSVEFVMALTGLVLAVAVIAFIVARSPLSRHNNGRI